MTRQRDFAAVILAAGKGTRMQSDVHKVLHPIAGRSLLEHLLASVDELGPHRTVVVVGSGREQVEPLVAAHGGVVVVQEPQQGTAHAVLAAKDVIAPRYADLVYEGRWWTTEREAYDAFVNATQQRITGTVTLRLYKGSVTVVGRESAHALYDERFVTFGEDDVYQQSDAAGFIRLFALPARVRAIKDQELAAAQASSNGNSVLPAPSGGVLAGV